MASLQLSVNRKDKTTILRKGYHRWRQQKRTAKLYIATLFAMCEGVCPACGVDMVLSFNRDENNRPNAATLDHIEPLSEVEETGKYGLMIMCKQCNSGFQDREAA